MAESKDQITSWLKNLNSDKNSVNWDQRTNGRAPHKPFLLFSILDGLEQGWIRTNRIKLTQELKDAFFIYWNAIMGEERKTKVSTPFTYLDSEPFWRLENGKIAVLDASVFEKMKDKSKRDDFRRILLREYFPPETSDKIIEISQMNGDVWNYSKIIDSLAAQPFEAYKDKANKRTLTTKEFQKRDRGFSLYIRRLYDYRCAICKTKLLTPEGASLTEGAHIIPWSESYNDDPRNGLSLCRNHHWMFDNKLITVKPSYQIKLSPVLSGNSNQVFLLDHIKDGEILLPENNTRKPSQEALQIHYETFLEYHRGL